MLGLVLLLQVTVAVPPPADTIAPPRNLAPTWDNLTTHSVLPDSAPLPADTTRRVRAVEYDGGYATRLKIHQIASYVTVPLFVAEYFTGDALLKADQNGTRRPAFANAVHAPIAVSLLGLFGVNTITGLWNLRASRGDPAGKTRRTVHSVIMLVADAGFTATAIAGGNAHESSSGRSTHRALALSTIAAVHRPVVIGLVVVTLSGVLLFAADVDTFAGSVTFWVKMALIVALTANGLLMQRAERRRDRDGDDAPAWRQLRLTSIASRSLWLLTTLAGVMLVNAA